MWYEVDYKESDYLSIYHEYWIDLLNTQNKFKAGARKKAVREPFWQ